MPKRSLRCCRFFCFILLLLPSPWIHTAESFVFSHSSTKYKKNRLLTRDVPLNFHRREEEVLFLRKASRSRSSSSISSTVQTSEGQDIKTGTSQPWDWNEYTYKYDNDDKKMKKSQLDKAGGIIYRQSIFTNEEFISIQSDIIEMLSTNKQTKSSKKLYDETTSSVAQNRLGASLSRDCRTVQILQSGSLCKYIQRITDDDTMELSSHLPVEIRSYEKIGAGMSWHEDDVLYSLPQVEVVITLENNSDCVTMWKIGNNNDNNDNCNEQQQQQQQQKISKEIIKSQETEVNSVLLIQAGGPLHCVTPLKRGKRVILKCAFASRNATFQEGIHKDQFGDISKKSKHHQSSSSLTKKGRRKKR